MHPHLVRYPQPVCPDTPLPLGSPSLRASQGGEREKKKVMKASDKFKFNFDWDNKEDTSRDLNPLYNNLHREYTLSEGGGTLLVEGRNTAVVLGGEGRATPAVLRAFATQFSN
jgi:hypothetical protein